MGMSWYPDEPRKSSGKGGWIALAVGVSAVLVYGVVDGAAGRMREGSPRAPSTTQTSLLPGNSIPPSPGEAYKIGGVGSPWLPGIYESSGGPACSWVIQRDLAGDESSVIRRGSQPRVGLREGEYFTSDGCGTWRRVGRI